MSEPLLSSQVSQGIGAAAAAIGNSSWRDSLKNMREERFANLRPVGEFFDVSRIKFTTNFGEVSSRWSHNLKHFRSNYLLIIAGLAIYSIFTSWWLLFTIVFIAGGFYLISRLDENSMLGRSVSPSTLYAVYIGVSLLLLLFSGATGAIFWIIGAAAILILGHAALLERGIESDFAGEQV